MTIRSHIRENLHLALPVMLSNLGHVLMGVTDTVMVGHLNAESLAAAGLALVVFNVFMLFGIGVSYAITPLVAAAHGEKNDSTITETLRHGLVINVINAAILIGVVEVGKNLLYHINQPAEVVERAIPFLSIIAFSLVPMMIFQTFKQFAEGMSNTRVALVVMIFANILNVILNYILIYGHLGFSPLGLVGSGWATFTSRVFMAIAIAVYIYYMPSFRKFRDGFSLGNYSKRLLSKMLHLGIPSGVQFIFEAAAFDFSLVMMGWLGTKTQAAHQIAINLATLSYMITTGLATAATIRVGYFSGTRDYKNMRLAVYTLLGMALLLMTIFASIFIIGNNWLPTLYINDSEVIPIAASLLVVAALFQLSDGTQVVCASALRGLQDVKIPSVFILISYWIIGLPLGYWLAFKSGYGAIGIWLGLFIGLTLTALGMFWRLQWMINRYSLAVNRRQPV
jgi:MATE family multidrug resistance protein